MAVRLMANTFNYPGDRANFDPDQILGPDLHGAYYVQQTAIYNPNTNRTAIRLRPLPPDELRERASALLGGYS
jgi:hypothetical protein